MVMVTLRALGESVIEIGDVRIGPDAEILFALLTYLIIERGRPISREELIEMFWTGQESSNARHCLRQAIYKLRRLGVPVETRFDRYYLAQAHATVDYERLTPIGGSVDGLLSLRSALIFDGFAPSHSRRYQEWLDQVRASAGATLRHVLVARINDARRRNTWAEAALLASRCLEIDPMNEEATLTLAEATALGGNKREAVRLLDSYLHDLGDGASDIRLPAKLLRSRIVERVVLLPSAIASGASLVGRDQSLTFLTSLVGSIEAGVGRTCIVYGEAGLGKTRLITEFANITAMGGLRVVRAACQAHSSERPLAVLMELVPQLLRLPGALGCDPEALSLARRLAHVDIRRHEDADCHDTEPTLDSDVRAALCELVDAVASERPLICIVEDAHWLDRQSLSVLRDLTHSNNERQLLLLLTARGSNTSPLVLALDKRQVVQHGLLPLSHEASQELATRVCNLLEIPPTREIVDWALAKGDGNPLLITQLLAHYRDTADRDNVPASIEAIIDERLKSLSAVSLRTLQTIGLAGRHAQYERLEVVLGLPRWEILSALNELDAAGLLTQTVDGVAPKHDLVAEAAQRRFGPAAKRYVHRALALSLESDLGLSNRALDLWDAAQHWEAAGDSTRAAALTGQCADHMLDLGLAHDASLLLERAITITRDPRAVLGLYEKRSSTLKLSGEFLEMERNALAAQEYAGTSGLATPHSIFEVHELEAKGAQFAAPSNALYAQALRCASDTSADRVHRLQMATWGLAACYATCEAGMAAGLFQSIADIKARNIQETKALLDCALIYHVDFGNLSVAIAASDSLLALERESARPYPLSRALRVAAFPRRVAGDIRTARAYLEEAHEVACSAKLTSAQVSALIALAQYACDNAEYQEATRHVQTAAELLHGNSHILIPQFFLVGAEVALMQGDTGRAADLLSQTASFAPGPCRYEFDRIALRTHSRLQTGQTPHAEEVASLLNLHKQLRPYFGQDYPSAVLFCALRACGRDSEASGLLKLYLTRYRCSRGALRNPLLFQISRDFGFAELAEKLALEIENATQVR